MCKSADGERGEEKVYPYDLDHDLLIDFEILIATSKSSGHLVLISRIASSNYKLAVVHPDNSQCYFIRMVKNCLN